MNNPPGKLCPRCQTLTGLAAPSCLACGHVYRTRFSPSGPPSPQPASHKNRLDKRLFFLAIAIPLALVMLVRTAAFVKDRFSPSPEGPIRASASPAERGAGTMDAPAIYKVLYHGMTEKEMVTRCGKPDVDYLIERPGIYGGPDNSVAERQAADALPPGRSDGGQTRRIAYKRGGQVVDLLLINSLDNEHPMLGMDEAEKHPVWVVMQYILL